MRALRHGAASDTTGPRRRPAPKGRKAKRSGRDRWFHALDVLARTIAAIFGGYVATAVATAVLARLMPGPRVEATIAATTFSFVIYATVAIWAFAARKAWRFWAALIVICAALAGVLVWSLGMEPRL